MAHSGVPPAFEKLAEDLLIHSDWERVPPPSPTWVEEQWQRATDFVINQRWRVWSSSDWLIALTIAATSVAVARELVVIWDMVQTRRRIARAIH